MEIEKLEIMDNQVLIEIPTNDSFSLMIDFATEEDKIRNRNSGRALTAGWYKIIKAGKNCKISKEDSEGFVFFHNKTYEFDSRMLADRKEQRKEIERLRNNTSIFVPENSLILPNGTEKEFKDDEGNFRIFTIIPESFIQMVRPYEEI
jgi:hypothetical protein